MQSWQMMVNVIVPWGGDGDDCYLEGEHQNVRDDFLLISGLGKKKLDLNSFPTHYERKISVQAIPISYKTHW